MRRWNAWIMGLWFAAVLACTPAEPEQPQLSNVERVAELRFPDGFLLGTATAGFQVDMGCPSAPCMDEFSDWYQWATHPEIIEKGLTAGHPLEDGPGHWELFETDFDLKRDMLHSDSYRMSFEWSRIFTSSTVDVEGYENLKKIADAEAVAHYHRMLDAMHERGIEPLVTLNHYSLPLWIHDGVDCHLNDGDCENAGWLDGERIIPEMAKYAGFVAREFGHKVNTWFTHNEPYAVILPGYVIPLPRERVNPPGLSDGRFALAKTVLLNMIEAHARMYDAVKAAQPDAQVGIVLSLAPFVPADPESELDVAGAEAANYVYNDFFLDALVFGHWDPKVAGAHGEVREDLKDRVDVVGVNYYTRVTVKGLTESIFAEAPAFTFIPIQVWEYNPESLYDIIFHVWNRYDLPILITETGTADNDGDDFGPDFLVPHLAWVLQAVEDGADVRGFLYWSLVDNYEWNHGFDMLFGLFSYDPVTKERFPKKNALVYGEIVNTRGISVELLEAHGGGWLPGDTGPRERRIPGQVYFTQ
jgi:beta-galactosidase